MTPDLTHDDHEVVERFAASRRELAADPYRPLYHFTSPEGGLNIAKDLARKFNGVGQ